MHQRGDHFKGLNFTVEGLNRQLIRNANLYANLVTTHVYNQEKQLEILGVLPKDVSLNDLQTLLLDVNANMGQMEVAVNMSVQDLAVKVRVIDTLSAKEARVQERVERFGREAA